MEKPISINFLDLSLSLSETLDFVSPLLAQHQIRTTYIAWRIGKEYQLPSSALEQIVFAALLHDIGALSSDEKIHLHEDDYNKNTDLHCIYGEKILNQTQLFKKSAQIIRFHHKEWQEWEQKTPTEITLLSQIIFLADVIERGIDRSKYILHQNKSLVEKITKISGTSFYPDIVTAFRAVAESESFWLECMMPSLPSHLRQNAPGRDAKIYQSDFLEISKIIKKLVDLRSNFTATHSTGVSSSAALLAKFMGYPEDKAEMMEVAGNLHDVGKLVISNQILEKGRKLTQEEFSIIKKHAFHTLFFMQQCGFPKFLIEWAGYHHEKLDGTGYPLHVRGDKISHGARVVAIADILTAIIEDRPYRKGLRRKDVLSILDEQVRAKNIDAEIVGVLKRHYDEIVEPTLQNQKVFAELHLEDVANIA